MKPKMSWWRHIVAADIIMHLIAIWWFAYLPPSTLNEYEVFIMVVSTLAGIGVLSHAFRNICSLPLARWSYLLSGFVCLLTFSIYEVRSLGSGVPIAITVPLGLFLLAGVLSSFAAHVVDGGRLEGSRCGG